MILVTGPTGNVGYPLLESLDDAGVPATAMVRTDAGALDLPPRVKHVVGALDDPPAPTVLRQFDQVFLLSPDVEGQAEMETIFIDAVVAAGRRPRIVKMAYDGFQDPNCAVRFMQNHRLVATHLDRTGLPVVYLAPTLFMEELVASTDTIRDEGLLPVPVGAARVAIVAARDVADVAAAVLSGEAEVDDGDVVVLTGPEALSFADVADRISSVFARAVAYDPVSPEVARSAMRAGGLTPWQVDGRLELYEWISKDAMGGVTEAIRRTTGHEPRPLEDWLDEARAAFLRPAGTSPPRF